MLEVAGSVQVDAQHNNRNRGNYVEIAVPRLRVAWTF